MRFILATVLAAGTLTGATPSPRAEPFSFRGLTLGASLTELRRMRYPEAPAARILCSHDAEARDIRPTADFVASQEETQAGVKVCGAFLFTRALPASNVLPPEWLPARVKVATVAVAPAFWFVSAEGGDQDGDARLYRIAMRSNSAFWEETRAAFINRYGKPTTTDKGVTATARATVENETLTWSNAVSTIRLVKRDQFPNRMLITFHHHALTPGAQP
ncbi:MAG: hypothetical protein ABL907_22025 [Hyphomicrobium sp.]